MARAAAMNRTTLDSREAIRDAVAAYGSRELARAEALCRAVLGAEPDAFDALNLLGVIAARTGRPDEAAELLKRAVGQRPENASAHNNLGQALTRLERLDEALASFERALRLRPDFAGARSRNGPRAAGNAARWTTRASRGCQPCPGYGRSPLSSGRTHAHWWRTGDSNPGPKDYDSSALTS